MSHEPERVFSSAKLLISNIRNRLGDDIIEASECLKSWIQQGLIFGATGSDQCSEAASPDRFTVDLDRTIEWAASRLLTQAGHRYCGQRSDRTADIWPPMVINYDIKNKAKAARYLPVYADYMQSDVGQSKAIRCSSQFTEDVSPRSD